MTQRRLSPKDLHDTLRQHHPEPGDQWLWKNPKARNGDDQRKRDEVVCYLDATERVELKPENYEGRRREVSLATLAKSYEPGEDIADKYERVCGVPQRFPRMLPRQGRQVDRPSLHPAIRRELKKR